MQLPLRETVVVICHDDPLCICVCSAVQFEGVEKGRMSPTKDGKSRPPQRHSSGCLVNMKMGSMEQCMPTLGERIDPSMPLENQL